MLAQSLGRFPVGVVSRSCLANLLWDVLVTWPKQRSWDLSIRRSDSTVRAVRMLQLRPWSRSVTLWIFRKNPICVVCTWDRIFSVITQDSCPLTIGEDRNKDRCKNWRLCGGWKLPFCDHRAIRLTMSRVCSTNPHINLLVPFSVTREYRYHWQLPTYKKWISGLNLLKVNQNETLFQRSIPKFEQ